MTPNTADVEFSFTWAIDGFLRRAKEGGGGGGGDEGLDSQTFDINVNGLQTSWNLSVRFWTGEGGERLANPFVLCLNLLSSSPSSFSSRTKTAGSAPVSVGVRYKFGVMNRSTGRFEMGAPETRPGLLRLGAEAAAAGGEAKDGKNGLRSVGFRSVAIGTQHLRGADGDVVLACRVRLVPEEEEEEEAGGAHSLGTDLRALLGDQASSDLVLEAEGGEAAFHAHKNILAARSPVFASLLKKKKQKEERGKCEEGQAKEEKEVAHEEPGAKLKLKEKERLRLGDLKAETVSELLSYIYTDVSANADTMPESLLAAADAFQLPGLKSLCERHLGDVISPRSVASVLLLADRHGCGGLKKSALSYCKDNHACIMKDAGWKTIEEEEPELFEEAVSEVVPAEDGLCGSHAECLKRKGKRFEIERESSVTEVDKED